jgi:hypothetical protein
VILSFRRPRLLGSKFEPPSGQFVSQSPVLISPLGCDVSRLRDFIVSFYANNTGQHVQVIDDAFCAFVWDIVVQQPTVRVGTVPSGAAAEVYIAPQASAKKKAKAKGEDHLEEAPPVLDLVPDANVKTLDQLKAEYGERLRIAVDPETSFVAITGSHLRVRRAANPTCMN